MTGLPEEYPPMGSSRAVLGWGMIFVCPHHEDFVGTQRFPARNAA